MLTTDYPDVFPVLTYARSDDLRRRVRAEFDNRADPANMAVLDRMVARRDELARLLGFAAWADYAVGGQDGGLRRERLGVHRSGRRRVGAAADARVRDTAGAQAAGRSRRDGGEPVGAAYLRELVRRAEYGFDSQQVRPYFPYERVKQGVLDLSARLFGVTFRA